MKSEKKIFYGWWVILSLSVVAAFGPMGRHILTPLFPFIQNEMGWSRKAIGAAFTIQSWTYGVIAILTGRLIDTIGGRGTIFLGGALLLVGLFLLPLSKNLWHFYLVFGVVMAFGLSMTHFVPTTSIARKWFARKAGTVTGIINTGTSLALAFLIPVVSYLSVAIGWRKVSMLSGLAFGLIIMFLAFFVIRSTPESIGLHPYGTGHKEKAEERNGPTAQYRESEWKIRHIISTKSFWALFFSYSLMGIPLQGFLAHIIMWGVDLGINQSRSGLLMLAISLPSIPVRIWGGWLGDRFGKRRMLIFFNLLCVFMWTGGYFLIYNTGTLFAFAALFGLAYSPTLSLYTPYIGDLFGRSLLGTLMGMLTLGHGIIGGVGPALWGWIFDKTGFYNLASILCAVSYLIVVLGLFIARPVSRSDQKQ